ncbi:MAG: CHAP domain-containing protein [Pseudomonadota bacterium]
MTTVEEVLARALSMVGRGTLYWLGTGGLDPHADSPAAALAVGREWPRLPPDQQAMFRPLAEAAGLNVDDPALVVPACDCSGYVCWALGISRRIKGADGRDLWINTDSIWDDATGPGLQFQKIDRAIEGCLVVYPKPEPGSGENFGHVGLVIQVDPDGHATHIAHCAASNFTEAPHDAIKVNAAEAFQQHSTSVYAWFRRETTGSTPR